MKKIYIKTTETCQLKCEHCYIGDNRKKQGFFDENKTINWIKSYIEKFNIKEKDMLFSFHGGEPFLCPLSKMQKVIDSFPNSTFNATSNLCFELNDDILNFIKNNFIDKYGNGKPFIKTSWDYKIRFSNSRFSELWENSIKKIINSNIDVRVIICLTSKLIKEMEPKKLYEFLINLGIKDINFERLTANTTMNKDLIPDYDEQDEWLCDFYDLINTSEKTFTVGMFDELKYACNKIYLGCRNRTCMKDVITINADGSIGGCPNSSIKHFYTNINESPTKIIDNNILRELIKNEKTKDIECYSCDLFKICNGDCHQLSRNNGKCATPKKLIRRIYNDLEREKKVSISNVFL